MFPFPRELERQLKKMGLKVEELRDVKLALIETGDKEIIIENPQVIVITMKDQKIYQIVATKVKEVKEEAPREHGETLSEEDIRFVAEQAGIGYEEAREILKKAGGDIAKALIMIQEEKG